MLQFSHSTATSPRPGTIRFKGRVGAQMDRFLNRRLRSEEGRLAYQEAEDAFRNKLDDASGVHGIWQGEFWGKWIIGAVRTAEYYGDDELREFIRRGVHRLLVLQEPSGYLGTYRDPMNVFAADPARTEPVLGWPCNWNWNIWCRKYTLWGLLEAWRLLGDPEILAGAERLAAHLIHSLREHHIRLGSTGTFAGIPSGSILKPMVLLYRATGNGEFLDFAKEIAADWKRPDNLAPNLIANALSGRPVHEWYPEPKEWAKVYEMLSCFDGLIELYRETGDRELLAAAEAFHTLLHRGEYNLLFSVGFNDIFRHAGAQLNAISEPCDVLHWMRLCYELFVETGEKRYLDDFELAFLNPFLAAACREGSWGARGVRSHGRHLIVFEQAGMRRNHCCVNNMPRGFLNAVQAAVTLHGGAVSINLYVESEGRFPLPGGGELSFTLTGDYAGRGEVLLTLELSGAADVPLCLRIPGWATSAEIESSGVRREVSGEWIEEKIPAGRSEIRLRFGRKLEIRRHLPPAETDEWYEIRWSEPAMKGMFRTEPGSTLVYGPLLLARSKFIGNTEAEMFGPALEPGFDCRLRRIASEEAHCVFEADFGFFTTRVCDYASAGNAILDDVHFFSVYF